MTQPLIIGRVRSRLRHTATPDHFTIVVIPDSQYHADADEFETFVKAQVDWIIEHRFKENIALCVHVGDVVQNRNFIGEWAGMSGKYKTLLNNQVPFCVSWGNWDMGTGAGIPSAPDRDTTQANSYFPRPAYSNQPWFGGTLDDTDAPAQELDNGWGLIDVGHLKFLLIWLEFGPRSAHLDWANHIVEINPGRRIIYVSHSHLGHPGDMNELMGISDSLSPRSYGIGADANTGQEAWDGWLKKWPMLQLTLGGHAFKVTHEQGYLGPVNTVVNGGFDDLSGWMIGPPPIPWAITNGAANKSAGSIASFQQACLQGGRKYRIQYTVRNRTAGTVRCYAGTTAGLQAVRNDTFVEELECAGGLNTLKFESSVDFAGSIDEVSAIVSGGMGHYGNPVHNFHANYQALRTYPAPGGSGGDGYIRILRFFPARNVIEASTYSPFLGTYRTGTNEEFSVSYDMAA